MSEEEGLMVAKQLLNLSDDVCLAYTRLLDNYYLGYKDKYNQELSNLDELIKREKVHYNKIDDNVVLFLLNEMDVNDMLSSIENNLDKYTNIVNLGFNFSEVSYYRILNLLRDNYIINSRLSRFDDKDLFDYELEDYNAIMLNNIIVENQIFDDFLSLFVANLNECIKNSDNSQIKKDLNIYKYITVYVFGKNNFNLLDINYNVDNTYIHSKLLYDMLVYADRDFSYNYDIMKIDYLDKVLYIYLNNYRSGDKLSNIINSCFMKSMIMFYGEDYNRVAKIYNDKVINEDKLMNSIINNRKMIASKAKVLTLNK